MVPTDEVELLLETCELDTAEDNGAVLLWDVEPATVVEVELPEVVT